MDESNKKDFADLMTGIAEIYGKQISKAALRIWWAAMARFSFEQVSTALNAHAQRPGSGRWFPTPADIVERIEGPEPSAEDVVAMAMNPTSPLAVLCRAEIGTWNL